MSDQEGDAAKKKPETPAYVIGRNAGFWDGYHERIPQLPIAGQYGYKDPEYDRGYDEGWHEGRDERFKSRSS